MLRRLFSGPLRRHLRLPLQSPVAPLLAPTRAVPHSSFNPTGDLHFFTLRLFSASGRDGFDGPGDKWKISPDSDESKSSLFGDDAFGSDPVDEVNRPIGCDARRAGSSDESKGDLFADAEQEGSLFADTEQEGGAGMGHDLWDESEEGANLFVSGEEGETGLEGFDGGLVEEKEKDEFNEAELDRKEEELRKTLKGMDSPVKIY